MSKVTKAELKQRFLTGKTPTQTDYFDQIDSLVHIDDQTAVDQQVVNTKIAAYDATLKVQNTNGHCDTLGDLLSVFNAFDDVKGVQPTNSLTYVTSPIANTDTSIVNPAVGTPIQKWLIQDIVNPGFEGLIKDIRIERRQITISGQSFYVDTIVSVSVGIRPVVRLQP